MLRNHWLKSAAVFAPPGEGDPPGDPPDAGDDRIPEPEVDDDETPSDPVDETDEADDPDDAEGDDTDEGDGAGEPPVAGQSRGNRQMGELRRQARERAEENARLTRELAGQVTALRQPAAPAETPQQRAERLALMSPEERTQEIINESLARHSQNTERLQAQLLDQSDKQSYDTRCLVNPLYKKFANKVEAELQGLRQKGQNLPRETIATYLIGQAVLNQRDSKKSGGNRQERRRQEARPVRSGGDVQNSRARQRQSGDLVSDIESRFGDVQI